MYYKNLIGKKINDWTVIDICPRSRGHTKVMCQCKCRNTKLVDVYSLTHNGTKSCGKCNTYFDTGEYMRCVMKNGASFIFDKNDFPVVSKHTWSLARGYIRTVIKGKSISLHRLLLSPDFDCQVDHINHDRTDNRRSNLRLATHAENQRNRGLRSNNTTGYKGVCYVKRDDNFIAYINANGTRFYLGSFETAEEAGRAYDAAAEKLHGEFACRNSDSA